MTEAEREERERMIRTLETLLAICTIELDIEQRAAAARSGLRVELGQIHPDWGWLSTGKAA